MSSGSLYVAAGDNGEVENSFLLCKLVVDIVNIGIFADPDNLYLAGDLGDGGTKGDNVGDLGDVGKKNIDNGGEVGDDRGDGGILLKSFTTTLSKTPNWVGVN